MDVSAQAQRNIRLFPVLKIFTKRVFLPLSAIYFMQVAGFSFADVGVLASFYYIVNFLSDVPTGVFADRFGRAQSLRIGALLNIIATLIYVAFPTKPMIFLGTALEAIGYGFLLGSGEALIHDSLEAIGKLKSYTKIVSRAQSLSLIINAILLALVPMTYAIDPRLPFLVGTFAYASLGTVGLIMKDVHVKQTYTSRFKQLGLVFTSKGFLGFAIGYGIIGALYTAPSDFFNLSLKQLGVHPSLLGWIFSVASIVGAIIGTFFYKVEALSVKARLAGDSVMAILPYAAVFAYSLPLVIGTIIISISVWRYRRIIYQDMMLKKFPNQPKATLLSAMSNLEGIHAMWLPFATGIVVSWVGLRNGLGILAGSGILISFALIYFGTRFFANSPQ